MSHSFPHRLGRTLSLFAGLMHLIWIILIWIGAAGPWREFVYGLHAINMQATIGTMSIGRAIGLLILALIMGYIVGWVVGAIWERVK